MLKVAVNLLLLRKVTMSAFNFPIKYSVILITILGALSGLAESSAVISNPFAKIFINLLTIWLVFYIGVKFMGFWLKRKGYWNGKGSLFNILAAASLVDMFPYILSIIGFPYAPVLTLPLCIYSLIIAGNAIEGATNSKIGYAIIGLILWVVIVAAFIVLISVLIGALIAPLF